MKRKIIFILSIISSILALFLVTIEYIIPVYITNNIGSDSTSSKSIGIIGGADGPTSIFVANSNSSILYMIVPMLIAVIGFAYLLITKENGKE